MGPYHYEDIPTRGAKRRFRVGDCRDNHVADFEDEDAARDFVRSENERYAKSIPASWKF